MNVQEQNTQKSQLLSRSRDSEPTFCPRMSCDPWTSNWASPRGGGINKGVFLDLEESQKERDTREKIDYKRCHGEGEKKEEKYSYYIH